MPEIQPGLVHTVRKDYCVNCKLPRAAHLDGACMFDVTQFREETLKDHEDCICESVTEIDDPVVTPEGTLVLNGRAQPKTVINYITVSFTV